MIDYTYADLYYEDSINKQLNIEAEDGTVLTNTNIYSESMTIKESLCSSESLTFGSCEASSFELKIANQFTSLYGQKITVTETLDGNTDEPFQLGIYKVYSDVPTADRIYRTITAYDAMYDIINADATTVAEWYNTILPEDDSTVTMLEFRTSFLELFGIEQEDVELINDDMVVEKTVSTDTMSGKDVIQAICEINGCFGHIGRDGKFQYIYLEQLSEVDGTASILGVMVLGQAILGYAGDGISTTITSSQQTACDYEDFVTQTVTKLQIRQEENDVGVTVGDGDNCYIVEGNFLVYGKDTSELTAIAEKLYGKISDITYRPIKSLSAVGNPCIMVGDGIMVATKYQTIITYVLERTLTGIQALKDTYVANGTESYGNTSNSLESTLSQIKGMSNVLSRTLEETKSQITNVEAGLQSTIEQTASSILQEVSGTYATAESVTEAITTAEGYTDNKLTSYSTTSQMNSAISTAVSSESASILQTVSGTYATQGSVTEAIETAEGYTDSKLTNYTTTTDMNAAIETAVSSESASILQTVSGTYATTGSVTEAIATAEGYTDTKLTNYTTTTDMNAAIETAVSNESASITSEISKNYVQISTTKDSDGNVVANYTTTTEIYNAITQMISESENSLKLYVSETVGEGESVSSMLVLEIATDSSGTKYGKLSANADYIELSTGDLVINSKQLTLDLSGNVTFSGALSAASGTFSGDLIAAGGTFSGDLNAAGGTFSGDLNAAGGTFSGNLNAAGGTFSGTLSANTVTTSSIQADAVTAAKIDVDELSAISADVGTLTAGVIKSSNYVSGSAGVCIDLTNGTAEFSGDVRATSFSLGSAVFSIETTYITEKTIDSNGNMASSIGPYDYLKLSTSGDEGLVADAITVTYLGATTAYADGLHSQYVYTKYDINTNNIIVRNDVETYYLYCRTGYFTVGLSAADTEINGTLDVSDSAEIGSTLRVHGDTNFYTSVGISNNLTVTGIIWGGTITETSDSRLKTELESLNTLDGFFDSLKPGRFQYTYENSGQYHTGMYAQDVLESMKKCGLTTSDFAGVISRTVSEDDISYHGLQEEYGLSYTEFVPILIYQVQQEKKKTAALEAIVEGLQEQIEAIYEVIQASA